MSTSKETCDGILVGFCYLKNGWNYLLCVYVCACFCLLACMLILLLLSFHTDNTEVSATTTETVRLHTEMFSD